MSTNKNRVVNEENESANERVHQRHLLRSSTPKKQRKTQHIIDEPIGFENQVTGWTPATSPDADADAGVGVGIDRPTSI